MLIKYTAKQLDDFEDEIAEIYKTGVIKAPVHLRKGNAHFLIEIFKDIQKEDYVFNYWDSHTLALLKGVPIDIVKQAILDGKSISLCFPKYNFYSSGIVASLMGVAVGTAYAIKYKKENRRVIHFCGDMASETGAFFEAVKYAHNFDLPIKFIVQDNGISVLTDTREVCGDNNPWWIGTKYSNVITYFKYTNEYPHSGVKSKIAF